MAGTKTYYFIDESGTPQFFAKGGRKLWEEDGFKPVILLGMLKTQNREALRESVVEFQQRLKKDVLFNSIHSLSQPSWFLHASADHSDVILKTVEFIRDLSGFEFYLVIGRKDYRIFTEKHHGSATEFYFDLIYHLLRLDDFDQSDNNMLYLSQRQSSTEMRFQEALNKAIVTNMRSKRDGNNICTIVKSADFPELSVVDYLLWSFQRYILDKGERRYYEALKHQYSKIWDVFDAGNEDKIFSVNAPFSKDLISPFFIK